MKSLLKHQGCDICIYKCPQPIIISLYGKTFRGHKECMHEKMNEIRKENAPRIPTRPGVSGTSLIK